MIHSRNKNAERLSNEIPQLKSIPVDQREEIFKQAIKSPGFIAVLIIVLLLIAVIFYANIHSLLHPPISSSNVIKNSVALLSEYGLSLFLPLTGAFALLVAGRNYFVKKKVNEFIYHNSSKTAPLYQ